MKKYSSEIEKAIKKYLEDEKISYSFDLYEGDFRFNQEAKSRIKIICYRIHINYSDFIIYDSPVKSLFAYNILCFIF